MSTDSIDSSPTPQPAAGATESQPSSGTMKASVLDLHDQLRDLRQQEERLNNAYNLQKDQLAKNIAEVENQLNLLKDRVDVVQYNKGQPYISIRGWPDMSYPNRKMAILCCIGDLQFITRGDLSCHLVKGYYGTKDYSGYYDQKANFDYGWGPSHGNIKFSVGFSLFGRAELEAGRIGKAECEAIAYYLQTVMLRQRP